MSNLRPMVLAFVLFLYLFFYWKYEQIHLNHKYTPFYLVNMFMVPILLAYILTSNLLNYHTLCYETIICILCGAFYYTVFGIALFSIYPQRITPIKINKNINESNFQWLYFITLLLSLWMIKNGFSYGVEDIADEDIAQSYGSNGIRGHVLVFIIFATSQMMVFVRKNQYLKILIIIIAYFSIFFYQVKGWMIIPLILAFLIRNDILGKKIGLWKIFIGGITIFILFVISYLPSFGFVIDEDNISYFASHFTKYVYAGIGGLNEAFLKDLPIGGSPESCLPPFFKLFVENNGSINSNYNYLIINDENLEFTNVFTLYGTIYLMGGFFFSVVYMMVQCGITYYFYIMYLRTDNYWYKCSYYYWTIGLVLSFFSNYYVVWNIYELTLWSMLIGFLSQINFKTKKTIAI